MDLGKPEHAILKENEPAYSKNAGYENLVSLKLSGAARMTVIQ